jgi:hypothetical protein
MRPANTMMIAMEEAKIGRSMKKLTIDLRRGVGHFNGNATVEFPN